MSAPLIAIALTVGCSGFEQAPEQAPEPNVARPNILLIDVDSLRADRVHAQRNGRPVAPNMASLATRGVRFEAALAQAAWTVPSVASLVTGRHPPALEAAETSISWLDPEVRTLPEILGWYDYTSVIFWGQTLPATFGALSRGFDSVDMERSTPPSAYHQRVCSWLETGPAEPWLAVVHNIDLHAPPGPVPQRYLVQRLGRETTTRSVSLDGHYEQKLRATSEPEARAYVQALYDAQLSWYDKSVGKMLGCLQTSGAAERTVLVLTSNHGEDLFDHGVLGHGRYHFQSVLGIPLVIHDGRKPDARRTVRARVQTIDLAPTLLDLAGAEPDQQMEGRSLTPLLGGDESGWPERDLYSFSSLLAASLLRGEKKLVIHSLRRPKELEAERLGAMATSARPALYDLRNDPAEHTDLRGDQPELAATMERDLLAHVDRLLLRARGGEETPMDEAFLKALREGGYWEQVRPGGGPEEGGRALPRKGQRPRSPD